MNHAVRNYKDTVFRMLFNEKKALLNLYNALNHSQYTNTEYLEITTLENAVYANMKNDISFVFDFQLSLYEHQSTWNPNLPLRDLFYISRMLQNIAKDRDLYGSVLIKIPTPRFVVFYNGTDKQPDKQMLRLSSAYEKETARPELELCVTIYNINFGHNKELMESCQTLKEYAKYVQKVRQHLSRLPLTEAVQKAVDECIDEGILREFLRKNKAEVIGMSIFEYNEELHIKNERNIAMEQGLQRGIEQGLQRGIEQGLHKKLIEQVCIKLIKKKDIDTIAEELETDVHVIQKICTIADNYAPDYDSEKIFGDLLEAEKDRSESI